MSEWTDDKIALLRRQYLVGCSEDECVIFLQQVKRSGLDPFARQIYAMRRWNKKTRREEMFILVGIDGFRLIAERTNKYAGQVGPFWCGPDGTWLDVWLQKEHPLAAKVGVLRHDFKEVCWGVATWDSYMQTNKQGNPSGNWASMPDVMLSKVGEALALRKAFPHDLSGLYQEEEMDHTSNQVVVVSDEDRANAEFALQAFAELGVSKDLVEIHLKNSVEGAIGKHNEHIKSLLDELRKGVPWDTLTGKIRPEMAETNTEELNARFQ